MMHVLDRVAAVAIIVQAVVVIAVAGIIFSPMIKNRMDDKTVVKTVYVTPSPTMEVTSPTATPTAMLRSQSRIVTPVVTASIRK